MKRYQGKTVVVTGAGTGIGSAIARRLYEEGAKVALMGRREEPLKAVAASINALVLPCDAASSSQVEAAIGKVQEHLGPIDVLVCNAGGFGFGTLTENTDEDWNNSVQSNLNTAMVTARAAIPDLIAQQGNILMMASIAGLAAGPEACGYVTMKHALIGLAKSITRDFSPQGVRCNTICPGWVRTEMADNEMAELMRRKGLASIEEAYALVTRDVPLGKPAIPEDIANAVAFLCSHEASLISGAVLTIDGGATIVDVPTIAFA